MYKEFIRTQINTSAYLYDGESIEEKVKRVVESNEPIKDSAPQIFTERKDGVLPSTDIRTDRMEIAQDAMDKVTKTLIAQRDNKPSSKPTNDLENGKHVVETPVT